MFDSFAATPAEHIVAMPSDSEVYGLVSEMTRNRQLSRVVRELNAAVLDGDRDERALAVAALTRMGLWAE